MVLTEFSWTKSCHHRAKTATTCCWSFPPNLGASTISSSGICGVQRNCSSSGFFFQRGLLYRQGFYGVPPALRAIVGQQEAAPICSSRCSRDLPSSGFYVCDAWTIPLWASITTNRFTVTPLAAKIITSGVPLFTHPSLFLPSTRLRFRLHLPIPLLMVTEAKAQAKAQALLANAAANANAHAGTKISPAVVPEKIGPMRQLS